MPILGSNLESEGKREEMVYGWSQVAGAGDGEGAGLAAEVMLRLTRESSLDATR